MYINPTWIIVEFLRNKLTDPRTSRQPSSNSNSLTATTDQTEFQITTSTDTSLSHITSVTVDGTTQNKWSDYYIDLKNEKIIFFSGRSDGEDVVINFYEGSTNWIYWDKPNIRLNELSFPRIAVFLAAGTGNRLGNYKAPVESVIMPQIDIWTKEKSSTQKFTIDGTEYWGDNLAEYLAYQIMKAFEDYEDELYPVLYDYQPTQIPPRTLPFDVNYQCFHKEVEFEMKGLKIGRID